MRYTQLTCEQRYQIFAFGKAGWTQKDMAHELKVHRTTIYRELRRNKGGRGYRPKQAQGFAQERKILPRRRTKNDSLC